MADPKNERPSRLRALRTLLRAKRVELFGITLVFALLGASFSLGEQARREALVAPRSMYTVEGGWDLVRLMSAIEAGDVVRIGAVFGVLVPEPDCVQASPSAFASGGECSASATDKALARGRATIVADSATGTESAIPGLASDGMLYAHLKDGSDILVVTGVPLADAVSSLRGAGYASLFSREAYSVIDDVPAKTPAAPSGANLAVYLAIGVLIYLGIRFLRRNGGIVALSLAGPGVQRKGPAPVDAATRPRTRLHEVGGAKEAKLEVSEVVEFLRNPYQFAKLGAKVPRGVLLYGPPGTGKTLIAKAIAGEADVPFYSASGSDFVEMYVGLGAKRIRNLFGAARKEERAVIFIDEIDALARKRGGINGNDERDQTLNAMLTEMDGFGGDDGIVVIAATNRLDTLDPAVLRPGRFTRKVHVGLPDRAARRQIIGVHAAKKPLAPEVNLDAIAARTAGMSGAQLADVLNEAAIFAARRKAETISADDVARATVKVHAGASRSRSMDPRERAIIAVHELGHAFAGRELGSKRRVERISLYAHGEALGITVYSSEDNDLPSERDLRAMIVAALAGRAAEDLFFEDTTPGASSDFEHASAIADAMVRRYGMGVDPDEPTAPNRGRLGFLVAGEDGTLPAEIEAIAARAVRSILDEAYETARQLIVANLPRFWAAATALHEAEELDGDELDAVIHATADEAVLDPANDWRPADSFPRPWAELVAQHRAG